jgi:DNA (cytosine-5)-methyltransferase 1
MRYLSICSGIEAATQAWHPLGWQPVAFSEIEPFPSAVLAHHYPSVPNLGDMTRFREWPTELLSEVDILVGGTPCQAFSVAGLRQSLDDERGNLTLTLVHLHDHITAIRHAAGRPAPLLLWENVPGVLNTNDNAFGCFLGGLAGEDGALQPPGGRWKDAGYVRGPSRTIAWRLLDAQYFGLAQRRERVFLVAGPPGFRAEQVLFEFNGLRRDSPPSREEGQGSARAFETGPQGGRFTDLHPTIDTRCKDGPIRNQLGCGALEAVAFGGNNTTGSIPVAAALNANRGTHNPGDFESGTLLVQDTVQTLRGEGFDASEDGAGRGTPMIAEICPTLRAGGNRTGGDRPPGYAVRRLTPTECERLQGFPDDYTAIPWRGKPDDQCPDGPRYRALGNSMAVHVMRWIGSRIDKIINSTTPTT